MVSRNILKVLFLIFVNINIINADRKDGDYVIGGILSIHDMQNGTCNQVNYEGIAVSEAIRFAVAEINSDHKLLGSLTIKRSLGYDIRDSCNSIEKEKDIAYSFNDAKRKYRVTPALSKPVSVVIGRFDTRSLPIMQLLNFEKIPQLSYEMKNVNLEKVGLMQDDTSDLLSTYPEDQSKSDAIVGIVNKLKIEFTSVIVKDSAKGRAFLTKLQNGFNKAKACFSRNELVKSANDIRVAMRKICMNNNIRIVVFYGEKDDELVAIEEVAKLNVTRIIFISSNSWKSDEIKHYANEIEGMVSIDSDTPDVQGFKSYIDNDKKPIISDEVLFQGILSKMGAPADCGKANSKLSSNEQAKCKEIKMKLIEEMMKYKKSIAYAIDAVYAFANGKQKILMESVNGTTSTTLLKAMKGLDFQSPITKDKIQFNDAGNALAQSFSLYNIQGNTSSKLRNVKIGTWKRDGVKRLSIDKVLLKWKDGSKTIPISKCSRDCVEGEQVIYPGIAPLCCWSCVPCPNQTFSNTTNSKCSKCAMMEAVNPQKTKCVLFEKSHLTISSPLAEFAMFLMVIGVLFTFLSMFILNQNKDLKIMKVADNETMQILLLGCLLILLSAIVLLFKPTINFCIIYACVFNIALTIPLAALISKTWLLRSTFYNEDGTFKDSCFGSRPGFCIGLIILLIHVGLLGVGFYLEGFSIVYYDTDKWNVKHMECSMFRNYVFWISYGYNIALSIFINFFNCFVPNVEAHFGEYNWLCLTVCTYYAIAFFYMVTFFAFELLLKVEIGIVVTTLHAFVFLLCYILPKLHMVLFMNERKMDEVAGNERPEKAPLMFMDDDDEALMQMVAHAGGGDIFKQKIVEVKVQRETDEEDEM